MNHKYNGEYGHVRLCPVTRDEIEKMRILRNSCRDSFVYSKEITQEEQVRWFEKYTKAEGDFTFSVFCGEAWVGVVALYNLQGSSIEFGRLMISQSDAGKHGLGAEVTKCACEIAFRQMDIQRVHLVVYKGNIPAVKTYMKAGFTVCEDTCDQNNREMFQMELKRKE